MTSGQRRPDEDMLREEEEEEVEINVVGVVAQPTASSYTNMCYFSLSHTPVHLLFVIEKRLL